MNRENVSVRRNKRMGRVKGREGKDRIDGDGYIGIAGEIGGSTLLESASLLVSKTKAD